MCVIVGGSHHDALCAQQCNSKLIILNEVQGKPRRYSAVAWVVIMIVHQCGTGYGMAWFGWVCQLFMHLYVASRTKYS